MIITILKKKGNQGKWKQSEWTVIANKHPRRWRKKKQANGNKKKKKFEQKEKGEGYLPDEQLAWEAGKRKKKKKWFVWFGMRINCGCTCVGFRGKETKSMQKPYLIKNVTWDGRDHVKTCPSIGHKLQAVLTEHWFAAIGICARSIDAVFFFTSCLFFFPVFFGALRARFQYWQPPISVESIVWMPKMGTNMMNKKLFSGKNGEMVNERGRWEWGRWMGRRICEPLQVILNKFEAEGEKKEGA